MERINKKWLLLLLLFSGNIAFAQEGSTNYIFIGHCYQSETAGDKVDYRVESFDFSAFDGVWLGGDVCSEALLNYSTVQYIDSIFDLGNPETHWTLGNHDARNGNWEWYEEFTGRKTYYAWCSNRVTRLVLNTNLVPPNCKDMNAQFAMIQDVCDTISSSTDLVFIVHHGLWSGVPDLPPPTIIAQSDLVYWNANCDSVNTQFVDVIYPLLQKVKQRGINVTWLTGDFGAQAKTFDMYSVDSIRFMGCGLYHNSPDDEVLFIEKSSSGKPLSFTFHNLDSLLNKR